MNVSQLRETIDLLLTVEAEVGFQRSLDQAASQLDQLVSQPQAEQHQSAFATELQNLGQAQDYCLRKFEPAQSKRIEDIGGRPYFLGNAPAEITRIVQENPISPAVSRDFVRRYSTERQNYLTTLSELRERLDKIGVVAERPDPGNAELGFTIPRSIFDSEFERLLAELQRIRFIIRAFSEAATGSVEPVFVRQISTSDPLMFLGMSVATVTMFGQTVNWALNTWKKVEDIRKLRAETEKIKFDGVEQALEVLENSIKKTIESSIENQVTELMIAARPAEGRGAELTKHFEHALEYLFALIERGMTVEIRFLPREPGEADEKETAQFDELKELSPKLVFPPPSKSMILPLPPHSENSSKQA